MNLRLEKKESIHGSHKTLENIEIIGFFQRTDTDNPALWNFPVLVYINRQISADY